jgi:hypothetical protein
MVPTSVFVSPPRAIEAISVATLFDSPTSKRAAGAIARVADTNLRRSPRGDRASTAAVARVGDRESIAG